MKRVKPSEKIPKSEESAGKIIRTVKEIPQPEVKNPGVPHSLDSIMVCYSKLFELVHTPRFVFIGAYLDSENDVHVHASIRNWPNAKFNDLVDEVKRQIRHDLGKDVFAEG